MIFIKPITFSYCSIFVSSLYKESEQINKPLSYGCNRAVRFQVRYFAPATSTCLLTSPYLSIRLTACKKMEIDERKFTIFDTGVFCRNSSIFAVFELWSKSDKDSGQLIRTPARLPASLESRCLSDRTCNSGRKQNKMVS